MVSGHVFVAASLDGFIAREDGGLDWLLSRDDPAEDHGYAAFIRDKDGIVMGRGSFEAVAGLDPWPYDRPVVVLSSTLQQVPAHLAGRVRIMDAAPRAVMRALAGEGWRRAYVDGGRVVQSFLREGLIADMVVTWIPVLLGQGRRLFGPLDGDIPLRHEATHTFPSGLVQMRYRLG